MFSNLRGFFTKKIEILDGESIFETKNFFVRTNLSSVCEGHCMIIPKFNAPCFSFLNQFKKIDDSVVVEFNYLRNVLLKTLKQIYGMEVINFEYGTKFQSVRHAHIHNIPLDLNFKSLNLEVNNLILKFEKEFNNKVVKFSSFDLFLNSLESYRDYVLVCFGENYYVFDCYGLKKDNVLEILSYKKIDMITHRESSKLWYELSLNDKQKDLQVQQNTKQKIREKLKNNLQKDSKGNFILKI